MDTAFAASLAASALVSELKLDGALVLPPGEGGAWDFGPLADANGTIRARIVDAHLRFDADVTVPVRAGEVDFNQATVEHVGPDSRMGASRMGVYVDAPNGRSYLYQFAATPVGGVTFERGGGFGPWGGDRGKLRPREFLEGLLRQASPRTLGAGITDQTRLLLGRTALSGDLRLGDGTFAAPGLKAELAGRAQGHNTITLQSEAVGRGMTAHMEVLSVQRVVVDLGAMQMHCDEVTGSLSVRLFFDGEQLRFEARLADLQASGVRLRPA